MAAQVNFFCFLMFFSVWLVLVATLIKAGGRHVYMIMNNVCLIREGCLFDWGKSTRVSGGLPQD